MRSTRFATVSIVGEPPNLIRNPLPKSVVCGGQERLRVTPALRWVVPHGPESHVLAQDSRILTSLRRPYPIASPIHVRDCTGQIRHDCAERSVGDTEGYYPVGVDSDEGVVVAGFRGCAGHLLSPAADLDHPHLPRPH